MDGTLVRGDSGAELIRYLIGCQWWRRALDTAIAPVGFSMMAIGATRRIGVLATRGTLDSLKFRKLHDSLALDHLDEHDLPQVVAALAADLTAVDPGAAVRARAAAVAEDDPALHDPDGVRGTYLVAVQVLGL